MSERIYYSTEAAQHAKRQQIQFMTFAMLVGAGLGSVLTLMLSPISGKQVRRELESVIEDGKDRVEDGVEQVQRFVS